MGDKDEDEDGDDNEEARRFRSRNVPKCPQKKLLKLLMKSVEGAEDPKKVQKI